MHDEPQRRQMSERTGKHYCVRCMAIISAEEFQRNDHICDACAADDEYPLASTPEPKESKKKR